MRTPGTRFTSIVTALVMLLTAVIFLPCSTVKAGAESRENPFDKQDDKEVVYDRSKWIQPPEWNCPTIDPRDYEGHTMLFVDKIGVDDKAAGKKQRIYFSICNAEDPVSMMKFHVFYDTRLKVELSDKGKPMHPGNAIAGFTNDSAVIEDGQLAFYAYSPTDVKLDHGTLFMVDFVIPEDCEPGDFYPIGFSYVDDGIVRDLFINSARDDLGKLHMTYLFTKGIYNGYLYLMGEPVVKKADLTLKAPRDGEKCTSDPKAWFGDIPSDVNITDLIWAESSTMIRGTDDDTFKAGNS